MYKYSENRYVNAGQNEFYRYGKKAQEKIERFLIPNENGFYSMPVDGKEYYTIGTSNGKFGEFAKFGEIFLSVNKGGFLWAKVGTDKEEAFLAMVNELLEGMRIKNEERIERSGIYNDRY